MTPERWREIEAAFEEARNLDSGERATFLDRACASDETLRNEVESLLAADEGATGFLERLPDFAAEADEKTASDNLANEARLIERFSAELTGRYRLERVLGRGGMATVYLARDIRHDRPVAFKVLRWELARLLGRDRFQQEVRMAARLQHPHILAVHDSGETDGQLWFTMPFVDGESLRERLEREIQLPIADAFRIASEAAGALEYAHRHGVIHRDVKPENLLLTKDGNTVVADFGIARPVKSDPDLGRFTEPGVTVGTPAYMSPEQANGERVLDARTDVYSLGCVLYEMLAGEPPFTGPTAQALNAKRLSGEIPSVRRVRSAVPAAVEQLLTRTLAPVPGDRFPTAAAFADALASAQHDPSAVSTPKSEPAKRSQRQRLLIAASLALVTVAAVLAARWSHTGNDPVLPFISRPLTFAGNAEQPSLSPDGRKIAYVQVECDAGKNTECPVTLRVQEIGSEQSVVLA
ncbi:MAG: protein kinase, partial [Gemmatimonadaceae bacterium]